MKSVQCLLIIFFVIWVTANACASPRTIKAEWQYQQIENIAGFRLYHEGDPVCSTTDPQATSLSCNIDAPDGTSWFTLTALFNDGSESQHSSRFPIVFSSSLKAQFTANVVSGASPLPVTFDATASSGSITSYTWMFGDGHTGSEAVVNHTFAAPGSFTVTLKVTDAIGASDQHTTVVTVSQSSTVNIPPIAEIASSAAVGRAPLPVQFDGSGSSDSDGMILSFIWTFGDGTTGSSVQITHNFIHPGTFHPSLTVTDNGGLSNSASTPVLVQPPLDGNIAPTAIINASTSKGQVPLTVRFDGSKAYDPDGSISSYRWNFGDGTTASGVSVQHLFTQPAVYRVTLWVTDNKGTLSQPAYATINVGKDGSNSDPSINVIINLLLLMSSSTEPEGDKVLQ